MKTIIKRRVLISMLFIGLVLMGIFSQKHLPMEIFPNAELPVLSVNIRATSNLELDPTYVENHAAIPVEGAISSLDGVEKIETYISSSGVSIRVALKQNVDLKYAFLQLEQNIKSISKNIPEEFTCTVNKSSAGSASDNFMQLQILGEDDIDYVRNIVDKDITPYLESVDGIAEVRIVGGRQKSIEVIIDLERCKALNLTPSIISSKISANLAEKTFAGSVYENNKRYFVNVTAEYLATEDLGSIVVAEGPILLKDIAEIHFGVKEEDSYSRVNGKEVVTCRLYKSPLTNVIDLSEKVRAEIDRLNEEIASKGISIDIQEDQAEIMSDNINEIINLAISGAFLAIFVLFLFLRKIHIVSIVAFAIPISVFSSFYFFYLFGISINTLTLTGIALAVGMLLDNSIVVMENIYRLKATGMPTDEACVQGTEEVWKAVLAATITTIMVFLPFLFADRYEVKLIGEHIGVSIVATLTISLVVALLLIPMAVNAILKRKPNDVNFSKLSLHNRLVQIYMAILKMSLRRPAQVIISALVVLLVTVVLSTSLTLNTLREIQTNTFNVYITPPTGYTLQKTDDMIRLFEDELLEVKEIKTFTSDISEDNVDITIRLKDDFEKINNKSIPQLKDELIRLAEKVNISKSQISLQATETAERGGGGMLGNASLLRLMNIGSQSEKVIIKGQDFEAMTNFAEYLKYQFEDLDNISYSNVSSQSGSSVAKMFFDQYLMGVNDITPGNVANELNNFGPESTASTKYKAGDEEYDIIIRDATYDEKDKTTQTRTLEELRNMQVTNSKNGLVELRDFARINLGRDKGSIIRINQEKEVTLYYAFNSDINESKPLLEAAREEIDELVQGLDVPTGIAVQVVHEENEMDDFTFLILAAFVLIYMILASVFESISAPIVLMFTIPLAAIGSLLALLFTSNPLMNANVFIGFIILIGIVVNNSIILIDYTSLLRRTGNRKQRAIITSGLSRLRPILITAITTIVAMVPLALGTGEYVSGLGAPFAITVIGGLTMSTLLTLVIIPTLYSGMEDALARLHSQSWVMKIIQIAAFIVALTCVYFWTYTVLDRILYVILTVILVPGITWFLEDSLRRAQSNIIPADEELEIKVCNLVKIYGRPSRFEREWTSGLKIRERLGLKEQYREWKDLQPLLWSLPILGFMYYFTFSYQVLFLWAVIFAFITWIMTLGTMNIFREFCENRNDKMIAKLLRIIAIAIYYAGPFVILYWSSNKFDNSGGAIFLGMFWYIGIAARYLSNKINKENINIDLIDGRFRMLKKTIFRMASKAPFIGVKKKPFKALSSVSMEIHTGMFGLLGPNGAGKTTLMRIICGIFEQSYGKIFINGIDTQKKREELQGLIGYLPQEFGTYENLTAWEFLEYQALLKGIYNKRVRQNRIAEVLSAVHMYENKDKKIGGFSGGMKQRIGIAQTLLNLPRILVVDEPTAGLDPRERIRFRNLLVELSRNRIVIFSTHIIEDIASSCNQVGVINKGELKYHGTPSDMANIAKDVTWTFEVPVRDFAKLPSDLLVVHHIRQGDMIKVRCLSERKPAENAERILPALEDSYLWLLRTVKIENKEQIITQ